MKRSAAPAAQERCRWRAGGGSSALPRAPRATPRCGSTPCCRAGGGAAGAAACVGHSRRQQAAPQQARQPAQAADPQQRFGRLRARATPPVAGSVGVFPAGQRAARMELPALLVTVQAGLLLDTATAAPLLAAVNDAVTAGATAVVLDGSESASALYDAAVKLKELLRERAPLLLLDRLDIASAVGAEGVVLSPAGVPLVVARKMAAGAMLLGQLVPGADAAVAAAADGANFVLLQAADGSLPGAEELSSARSRQRSGNAIPVIAAAAPGAAIDALQQALPRLAGPADGFCLPLGLLQPAAAATGDAAPEAPPMAAAVGLLLQCLTESRTPAGGGAGGPAPAGTAAPAAPATVKVGGSTLRRLLSADKTALIGEERGLLQRAAALLEEIAPQMDELPLLRDAIANLDDAFLVVVVGEFNSGKSTVINALLGEKFLADGILPTTNEISVLRYADPGPRGGGAPELVQQADGLFVRSLPAALLREMAIVDTPGTNVILERQQRLTEEYVPRADLVLFVLSADRPLSESELAFLRYIRQWRKKVVFVVNKVDMLGSEAEVEQVLSFVSSNAAKLLQLDAPAVLPISGRAALAAKLACGSGSRGGVLDSWEDDLLAEQPGWRGSRFGEFEKFIYDFLVGAPGPDGAPAARGGEGLRLKLQTPLFVADALMQAAGARLAAEVAAAEGELAALEAVEMAKDAEAQRAVCTGLVNEALVRNARFVDRTLQLSNLPALTGYLFGGGGGGSGGSAVAANWDGEVVAGSFDQLGKQARAAPRSRAAAAPAAPAGGGAARAAARAPTPHRLPGAAAPAAGDGDGAPAGGAPETQASGAAGGGAAAAAVAAAAGSKSLAAVAEFKPDAARTLLEAELREAFLGTAGSAAGAQGLGLLAAGWLGNTLEDLLALTVAGLASYVAVLNLPLRRSDIKAKVARVAGGFADTVTGAMAEEAEAAVEDTAARVLAQVEPLEAAWRGELARLRDSERRRAELVEALAAMERQTANLQ
ncbi:hypothetical protein HT031_002803 [Scenedesmus sp. PABB004]|nr:hypothetical protein HT031_002803 [Scenedesmus sp. PABB004]